MTFLFIVACIVLFFYSVNRISKIQDEKQHQEQLRKNAKDKWLKLSKAKTDAIKFSVPIPEVIKQLNEATFVDDYLNKRGIKGITDNFIVVVNKEIAFYINKIDLEEKQAKISAINAQKKELERQKEQEREKQRLAQELEYKRREKKRKADRWEYIEVLIQDNKPMINYSSNQGGIYAILCRKTMDVYFGSTSNFIKRKYQHFQNLRAKKHHSYLLQEAFNMYGENCFEFHIIVPYLVKRLKEMGIDYQPKKRSTADELLEMKTKIKNLYDKGVKQTEIAKILGKSNAYISLTVKQIKIEKGES